MATSLVGLHGVIVALLPGLAVKYPTTSPCQCLQDLQSAGLILKWGGNLIEQIFAVRFSNSNFIFLTSIA